MTEEEAVRQAEAEGLTLLKADNSSGYKGVRVYSSRKRKKPYEATEKHLWSLVAGAAGSWEHL